MKNITLIFFAAAFSFASCGPARVVETTSYDPAPEAAPPIVSYQSFYDGLAPYGSWIDYPGYGYVWMPNAGPDFMPYNTNGNWIYTDAGWTWASNYEWGWAPFHYGRWFYEGGYGWMWVPGSEWAPAWVSWRGGNDYYGWAPLAPDVSVSVALGSYDPPVNYWNFVPRQYMGNPGWHSHYVDHSRNVTIINNTTIINNYSGTNRARYAFAPGPDPNEVRRVSGTNIQPVRIREASRPGSRVSGNEFDIYRPRVDAAPATRGGAATRPAPARAQNFRDLRPQTQNQNNNARPATQPAAQNPVINNNNSRPVTQPPAQNPAINNNPRPAAPPANNPRPATPPANNPRDVTQPPARNPAFNNNNNPRPVPQPATVNPNPATTGRPADSRYNQRPGNAQAEQQRVLPQPSPANRRQMPAQPPANAAANRTQPVQQRTLPQPSPANRRQMPAQPPANPPANRPQPVRQGTPAPQAHRPVRPEEKKTDKPVTRDAN